MKRWTLDDLPWDQFDPARVDPELVKVAKAAAMVERNGTDYTAYLCNVFHDDPEFQDVAREWGSEEVQHGLALGRWAQMADPEWDFEAAFDRFTAGYRLPIEASESVRGTRSGELVARCIVETGTSSFYSALGEACDEPVLKDICRRIAADEFRHYRLFYTHMKRYLAQEKVSTLRRFAVAFTRVRETEGDDELAYAYWAANDGVGPYNRKRCIAAYTSRAYRSYRPPHVERATAMIFKAIGLKPNGWLSRAANRGVWMMLQKRVRQLERSVA
jgi:rubrerythrin